MKKMIRIGNSGAPSHTVALCSSASVVKLSVPDSRISEISVDPRVTS